MVLKVTINALGRRRSRDRGQVILKPVPHGLETDEIVDSKGYARLYQRIQEEFDYLRLGIGRYQVQVANLIAECP